jgi:cobalamin synthase
VLQSVASGWLGPRPSRAARRTAALGLVTRFFIATVAAWVYYLASRRLPVLARRPVASGALYGVAVFVFMTYVVVPLSAVPRRPLGWGLAAIILAVHVVCVGWPIAWAVRRFGGLAVDGRERQG